MEQLTSENENEVSYAKGKLGVKGDEVKILRLTWNKSDDTIRVSLAPPSKDVTKRQVCCMRLLQPLILLELLHR